MAIETVTLSTLVADTGETARTINHWTDVGILRPIRSTDRKGRGNRRYYPAEPLHGERKHALMASALNKLRIPLAEIKEMIDTDRHVYDPNEDRSDWPDWMLKDWKDFRSDAPSSYEVALAGEARVYMLVWKPRPDARYETSYIHLQDDWSASFAEFSQEQARHNAHISDRLRWAMEKSDTAILLNLSKIFAALQPKQPVEAGKNQ
jgi:DNA-binding transcriptional MerR regulator